MCYFAANEKTTGLYCTTYQFLPEISWVTANGWMVIAGRTAGKFRETFSNFDFLKKSFLNFTVLMKILYYVVTTKVF